MSRAVFLDSGPLSLIVQRRGVPVADACRSWLLSGLSKGSQFHVAEIVDYELRRELIRAGKTAAVARLDAFILAAPGRYVPLTTNAMRQAARLWAEVRQRGLPTSDPRDLDVDVILAAQALGIGAGPGDMIVATTNPGHLTRFVAADLWTNI